VIFVSVGRVLAGLIMEGIKMKSLKMTMGLVFVVLALRGCNAEPDIKALKDWVKTSVASCSGELIGDLTLIREHYFSNKFVGFAEVKVKGNSFYPDILAYADGEQSFWKMEQNVCALAELQNLSN
jgi:hypothetical protein